MPRQAALVSTEVVTRPALSPLTNLIWLQS